MIRKNDNQKYSWWAPALKLFAQMSAWIVGPIILAVFVGRWLDKRFDTSPWLFLITVFCAFVITNIGIVKQSRISIDEITKQEQKDGETEKQK